MDLLAGLSLPHKPQSKPEGRPSDYTSAYCKQVIEHMSRGYSLESFAGKIEVHRDTLYEWQKIHPEFAQAVQIGKDKSLLFWETIGINGTIGVPVKFNGREYNKFNASIYALNMANKHKWTNRQDVTTDGQKIEGPVVYIPEEKK